MDCNSKGAIAASPIDSGILKHHLQIHKFQHLSDNIFSIAIGKNNCDGLEPIKGYQHYMIINGLTLLMRENILKACLKILSDYRNGYHLNGDSLYVATEGPVFQEFSEINVMLFPALLNTHNGDQ